MGNLIEPKETEKINYVSKASLDNQAREVYLQLISLAKPDLARNELPY